MLLVANYDSGIGYAWWLMESFWDRLAKHYHNSVKVMLAYPKITVLPAALKNAPMKLVEFDLTEQSCQQILTQCNFLVQHRVRAIYFSDRPAWHWSYVFYRLAGVKLIITHDHTPGNRPDARGSKAFLKRIINRLPWITVDGAIGASDFVQQRLIKVNCVPEHKCFSVPNSLPPVDPPVKFVDLHKNFNIPKERKIVIMTGRAHRYKGVEFALQCIKMYCAAGKNNLHFLFLGGGPDLERFRRKAGELGCKDHCTFPGQCEDIQSLLEGADIAIHPSLGEVGYSLSILEYMYAGLPLVVPDNPSVCGATEDNVTGIIYPQGDVEGATEALYQLVEDDELRQVLGVGAKASADKYSLENTHQDLLQAFSEIDKHGVLSPVPERDE